MAATSSVCLDLSRARKDTVKGLKEEGGRERGREGEREEDIMRRFPASFRVTSFRFASYVSGVRLARTRAR